jgi:hypothetical protein
MKLEIDDESVYSRYLKNYIDGDSFTINEIIRDKEGWLNVITVLKR